MALERLGRLGSFLKRHGVTITETPSPSTHTAPSAALDLPSAADLDAHQAEEQVRQQTSGSRDVSDNYVDPMAESLKHLPAVPEGVHNPLTEEQEEHILSVPVPIPEPADVSDVECIPDATVDAAAVNLLYGGGQPDLAQQLIASAQRQKG